MASRRVPSLGRCFESMGEHGLAKHKYMSSYEFSKYDAKYELIMSVFKLPVQGCHVIRTFDLAVSIHTSNWSSDAQNDWAGPISTGPTTRESVWMLMRP